MGEFSFWEPASDVRPERRDGAACPAQTLRLDRTKLASADLRNLLASARCAPPRLAKSRGPRLRNSRGRPHPVAIPSGLGGTRPCGCGPQVCAAAARARPGCPGLRQTRSGRTGDPRWGMGGAAAGRPPTTAAWPSLRGVEVLAPTEPNRTHTIFRRAKIRKTPYWRMSPWSCTGR